MYVRKRTYPRRPTGANPLRLILALGMAAFAVISFLGSKQFNPFTGQDQYINITVEQEIAIGLQAAPEMAAQYGGLEPNPNYQKLVDQVGQTLVANSIAEDSEYPFDFYVLADPYTVNAFALPGGQIFVTRGLIDELETEGQLAAVLSHEMVHVLGRHGAERIAATQLTQGLTGAVLVASYDPNNPSSQQVAQMAVLVGQLVNMKFGRDDEIQSDTMGLEIMAQSGYDPRAMIGLMEILARSNPGGGPEFFQTHPNPENRIGRIEGTIVTLYPDGVPDGMIP